MPAPVFIYGEESNSLEPTTQLNEFLEYLYGAESGVIYLATKNSSSFQQAFYEYPNERTQAVQFITDNINHADVYIAPALFSHKQATKSAVKGANVLWCEFDGKVPTDLKGLPEPSLKIKSSEEGHEHWYWKLDQFLDPATVENINRSIAYSLEADTTGWDCNQILRPPSTVNHKRNMKVVLLSKENTSYTPDLFKELPPPPSLIEAPVPTSIPAVENVVAKYQFSPKMWKLFKKGVPHGFRSTGLMALGYYCAELHMTVEECFAILLNADERWGKFKDRNDRLTRLLEIVTRAKLKYPDAPVEDKSRFEHLGYQELQDHEVHLEWAWEGFLQENGYMLLTGPQGIGKTQLALDLASRMVLGEPMLKRPTAPKKIGFLSLEMGLADLKVFVGKQAQAYSAEERKKLDKGLRLFPVGEPIYLNNPNERRIVEDLIRDESFDGLVIDSLGSVTDGELSSEKEAKNLMNWFDSLRQKYNCFIVAIHHHRKASAENKKPNKLSDVFGSQYITARATSVLCLWPNSTAGTGLELIPLKIRLIQSPGNLIVERTPDLRFEATGLTNEEIGELSPPEESKSQTALGFEI